MADAGHHRIALVTGAAGNMGSAIVAKFASEKIHVVATDLSAERLDDLARAVPDVETVTADVSTAQGVAAAIAQAGPRIDILVNIAGISDGGASVEELDDAKWERVLRINLTSTYMLCNRVTPGMIEREYGVILNMASVAGLRGGRSGAAYTSTKWAIVGLSQNIAASIGSEGVRCHAICPSRIVGAVAMSRGVERTARGRFRADRDAGRPAPGKPEDIAELASFLISDAAHHLNGLAIPADGGWLAY
jgi:NAD(P)-dependent dehydrogenase (short-subunit alcohol dehydrogenase family)